MAYSPLRWGFDGKHRGVWPMNASIVRKEADVRYCPTRKPSAAARALLILWTSRRRGLELPRLRDFTVEDLQPWLGGMVVTTHASETPQIAVYGGSLSATVGHFFAGTWRPEWPAWLPAIGWRTIARLRSSPEPFVEQTSLLDGDQLRIYDRLVLPLANADSRFDGWIAFLDNRRHLRRSARAGLLLDR